eukprot:6086694-Ditylum_brightwellii.AAC.1
MLLLWDHVIADIDSSLDTSFFENDHLKDTQSLTKVTFLSCPSKLKAELLEGNTPLHSCEIKECPTVFINGIVKGCPNAA